ncbi:alpha/beta fold hydrolase [Paenibacillus sp. FJAT-27812]|uniref:alpha/beta fold hydrolase n=1 Tax=Paenibacillus sp. FJAT-27812 TaxID=1684143 RepID=UPI0006A7AEA7|nr:alpha/beta fold hydrolase [Paenibacillus sp. FJAT-27812]
MAHVFITGGTGFIGSHMVRRLAAEGHRITALVRSQSRFNAIFKQTDGDMPPSLSAINGDLTQQALGLSPSDRELLLTADVIIHAGGPMDILLNKQQAKQVFLDAAEHLTLLADHLHKSGQLRHFIHVVGFKSPVTEQNINEQAAILKLLEHESPYERMKITADLHIRQQAKRSGYSLSVVNPSVIIGDSVTGNTEQTGGLGILIASARRKLMGTVPGGPKHWLPLVHVDHTAAFIAALVSEQQPTSDTYYLLDEQNASPNMTELIRLINKELRVPAPIGSISLSLLGKLLGTRIGSKLGIPGQSLSFIASKPFPLQSTRHIQQKHALYASVNHSILPHVIADLDYRLSHGLNGRPDFERNRRGPLATLENAGSGHPILLLPGTFSGADCLLPLAAELKGRQVWVADLPGFGRSPYHHSASVIEGHVQAIMEAIASQQEPVTLIGHSYGALLAAKVMERMPSHHIGAVRLLQPVLHPANSRYKSSMANRLLLPHVTENRLRKELLARGCFEHPNEIPDSYIRFAREELSSPRVRATLADTQAALTRAEHFRLQPESWNTRQTNIIWGTKEPVYTIPEAYSGIQTTLLPYGHHFPVSHPAETAKLLLQSGI